ncbi:MAG: DUF3037 domain-containing protein [Thiotrichaceae bacterium]|nr:DUF3037 domain-containing protein [Thiotrichaceae bacterium]
MKRVLCQYAVVRFIPIMETEEFINIGIVLLAPQKHFFGFKLTAKIAPFIHKEARDAYLFAKDEVLKKEFIRVRQLLEKYHLENHSEKEYIDFSKIIFGELIRPQETAIRFSEQKVLLSDNVENALEQLFTSYVDRNFVENAVVSRRVGYDIRHQIAQWYDVVSSYDQEVVRMKLNIAQWYDVAPSCNFDNGKIVIDTQHQTTQGCSEHHTPNHCSLINDPESSSSSSMLEHKQA